MDPFDEQLERFFAESTNPAEFNLCQDALNYILNFDNVNFESSNNLSTDLPPVNMNNANLPSAADQLDLLELRLGSNPNSESGSLANYNIDWDLNPIPEMERQKSKLCHNDSSR